MTRITGEGIDRIASEITEWDSPEELRAALMKRFPKWAQDKSGGRRRFAFFTKQIIERTDWVDSPQGIRYRAIQDRIVLAGPRNRRSEILTDIRGRYLGKQENVKIYSRHGKLYGKNKNTGRRAQIA